MTAAVASGFIGDFLSRYHRRILDILLADRTQGRNIIWADDEYAHLGPGYLGEDEIQLGRITGPNGDVLKPRIHKAMERQYHRTRSRAEVFTPSWLVNEMLNYLDEQWFGQPHVFNTESDAGWATTPEPVTFTEAAAGSWQDYVMSTRLEITCGEAPFVCSRYDTVTGEPIAVPHRVGVLDRKLRVISEQCDDRAAWFAWALKALHSTYGYEYQGDNLLVARINVFETLAEHAVHRWGAPLTHGEMHRVAWAVSWNFWQMDGLTCTPPTSTEYAETQSLLPGFTPPRPENVQASIFEGLEGFESLAATRGAPGTDTETVPLCIMYDWESGEPFEFISLKGGISEMKKFYAIIGNPPYQQDRRGDNGTYAAPIYHRFMDSAYDCATHVELIHPAKFLFNAGDTPENWNKERLQDPHFRILKYYHNSSDAFPAISLPGGLAISYRDSTQKIGPIGVFTQFEELNSIIVKISNSPNFLSLERRIELQTRFNLPSLYLKYPSAKSQIGSSGNDRRLRNNIFSKLPEVFHASRTDASQFSILGVHARRRTTRYVDRDLVDASSSHLTHYKVIFSAADGAAGTIGHPTPARILGKPSISAPGEGYTQTFQSIGPFESHTDAINAKKFLSTRFARVIIGASKVTQHLPPSVFKFVPDQDFTSSSDITWDQPIAEIDQQLYRKYGLSQEEIEFIETHVKEMD